MAEYDIPVITVGTADTDWVHKCLGAGKTADILLWRKEKSVSFAVLSLLTLVWYCVEVLEIHLIMLLASSVIFAYSIAFLFASGAMGIMWRDFERPVSIPQVYVPHEPFVKVAFAIHTGVYLTLCLMRRFVVSDDLRFQLRALRAYVLITMLLLLFAGFGAMCSFGTLSYILIMLSFVVPLLLEKTIVLGCNIRVIWEFYKCYKRWNGNHEEKRERRVYHVIFSTK